MRLVTTEVEGETGARAQGEMTGNYAGDVPKGEAYKEKNANFAEKWKRNVVPTN